MLYQSPHLRNPISLRAVKCFMPGHALRLCATPPMRHPAGCIRIRMVACIYCAPCTFLIPIGSLAFLIPHTRGCLSIYPVVRRHWIERASGAPPRSLYSRLGGARHLAVSLAILSPTQRNSAAPHSPTRPAPPPPVRCRIRVPAAGGEELDQRVRDGVARRCVAHGREASSPGNVAQWMDKNGH